MLERGYKGTKFVKGQSRQDVRVNACLFLFLFYSFDPGRCMDRSRTSSPFRYYLPYATRLPIPTTYLPCTLYMFRITKTLFPCMIAPHDNIRCQTRARCACLHTYRAAGKLLKRSPLVKFPTVTSTEKVSRLGSDSAPSKEKSAAVKTMGPWANPSGI